MGVPIILVIYNHMFHLYLENYRYNFSSELKEAMHNLFQKYFGIRTTVYPVDLFDIDDPNKIFEIGTPETVAKANINAINQKKVDRYNSSRAMLSNQLDGLTNERNKTTDPDQIRFIDEVIVKINNAIGDIDAKIANVSYPKVVPSIDMSLLASFTASADVIMNKIGKRTYDLIEFYYGAFGRVSLKSEILLNVWKIYLDKTFIRTPSMIFLFVHKALSQILDNYRNGTMNSEIKMDLEIITRFMTGVANYIELKESLPNSFDENPPSNEEYDQIVYLINLIVTPAMLNIILNQVYNGLKEMDGANSIITDEAVTVAEIFKTKFDNHTIETYLHKELPHKAYKYFTSIYQSSIDADRKITTTNDLFLPILNIIKANKIIQVTDNSILIQNLQTYLFPFMENTYQNFIHTMRLTIYGFERYLLNTYQMAMIFRTLVFNKNVYVALHLPAAGSIPLNPQIQGYYSKKEAIDAIEKTLITPNRIYLYLADVNQFNIINNKLIANQTLKITNEEVLII